MGRWPHDTPHSPLEALGPIRDVYGHLLVAAARWQDGRSAAPIPITSR